MSRTRALSFVWDEAKRLANMDKHGLDFATVSPSIFDFGLVQIAKQGRYKAIGPVTGRPVPMIFKPLGSEAIAIISLRPASEKERALLP